MKIERIWFSIGIIGFFFFFFLFLSAVPIVRGADPAPLEGRFLYESPDGGEAEGWAPGMSDMADGELRINCTHLDVKGVPWSNH